MTPLHRELDLIESVRKYLPAFLAVLVLIVVPFLLFGNAVDLAARESFQGASTKSIAILLIVALLVVDIVAPVPSSSLAIAAGAGLGATMGATTVWAGMTIACVVGYGLGVLGTRVFAGRWADSSSASHANAFINRFGILSLAVCRPIPVLAEASTIMAGVAALPFGYFLLVCALSNLAIAGVYAAAGAYAMVTGSFIVVLAASVLAPLPAWIAFLYIRRVPAKRNREGVV